MKQRITFWLTCFSVILGGCCLWVKSSQPMQLTVTFETSTTNGRYSPRNVHTVWVETADGTFIKTLDLWANKRAKHLTQWAAAAGDINNEIQARTGATQKAYGTYASQWDMTDADGKIVPNGDYIIRLELTSDNANKNNYHRASIPFNKSDATEKIGPFDQDGYLNIVLDYKFSDS